MTALHFNDGQPIYCEWTPTGPDKSLIDACGAPATVDDDPNDAWYCAEHAPQAYRVTFRVTSPAYQGGVQVGTDSLTVQATSPTHAKRVALDTTNYPPHFTVELLDARLSLGV